jgi:S1-C subfamily serine protease
MKTFIITLTLIAGLAADSAQQSISTSTTTTTTADGTKVVVVTEKDGKVEARTFQRPAPPGMPPRALPAGKLKMPYLGIALAEASEDLSRHLGLPDGVGVLVAQVLKDSPAAKAGLKDHDLLTRIDEQILFNVEQTVSLIRSLKAGQEIKLTFHRRGEERTAKAKLVEKEIGVLNLKRPVKLPRQGLRIMPAPALVPKRIEATDAP